MKCQSEQLLGRVYRASAIGSVSPMMRRLTGGVSSSPAAPYVCKSNLYHMQTERSYNDFTECVFNMKFNHIKHAGADPGGGGLSERLGIDFYSGFRTKNSWRGGGGGAIRNPKKIQV